MLHTGADLLALYAMYHRTCAQPRQERILRIIFKVSAAQRTSVDVDRRCKPHAAVIFLHLSGSGGTDLLQKVLIPGAGKHRCTGPCSRLDSGLEKHTQSRSSIRCHRVWNRILWQVAPSKRIRHACIRLSAGQRDQFLHVQLVHKRIQRARSVRNFIEKDLFLPGIGRQRQLPERNCRGSGQTVIILKIRERFQSRDPFRILAGRQDLKGPVRTHSL